MLKTYYHATPTENLCFIIEKGLLKGIDGIVYLTEKPEESIRFLAIRGYKKAIVCRVRLEEDLVEEQFDHNSNFFKCRAYGYPDNIKSSEIKEYYEYTW